MVVDAITLEFLTDRLDLAEQLLAGRRTMFAPQDLPGRYGRVVKAIDHVLEACNVARFSAAVGRFGITASLGELPRMWILSCPGIAWRSFSARGLGCGV